MLTRPVLLYDGACEYCRRWAARVRRWDGAGRIVTLPMARRAEVADLPPISEASLARAMQLVTPDGAAHAGGRAIREMLRYLPGGGLLRALLGLPGLQPLLDRLYDEVALRRHCAYLPSGGA